MRVVAEGVAVGHIVQDGAHHPHGKTADHFESRGGDLTLTHSGAHDEQQISRRRAEQYGVYASAQWRAIADDDVVGVLQYNVGLRRREFFPRLVLLPELFRS